MDSFTLSPYQQRVLMTPQSVDLFLGGGRGGGKSTTMALLVVKAEQEFGTQCRALYVRQSYPGLADFEAVTRELFGALYPRARYNATGHTWRFPSGATFELGQLEGPGDYSKYQGRSFSLLMVDELTQYPELRTVDLLRSNLRGPRGVPTRTVLAGNPGGPGHMAVAKRYVFGHTPWQPFDEPVSGRRMIYCPSTLADNPALDQAAYRQQLEAACASDPELLRAWLHGDWHIARGAFFADVIDERRTMVEPWDRLPAEDVALADLTPGERVRALSGRLDDTPRWHFFLAHDFGVKAPSVTYFCAESPGAYGPDGRYYPRGSVVLVDEHATYRSADALNEGTGELVPELASRLRAICELYGMEPYGVADDAIFSRHGGASVSIAAEFAACGVHFTEARKGDRLSGWSRMRTMLAQAGMPDRAGLYVSRRCEYWWRTVPFITRDPRRPEDVDSRQADHAADACRYALGYEQQSVHVVNLPRVG